MLKKQETGRSMVEMLGVLAIIGVLSVGGIAGYTTAMRSYKANEIINAASMVYMLGLSSNGGEGNGAGITYTSSIGGSLSALEEITYNANKTLTVKITEAGVCNQVQTKLGNKANGTCAASGTSTLTVTLGETNNGKASISFDSSNCDLGPVDCDMACQDAGGTGVDHDEYVKGNYVCLKEE